MRHGGGFSRLSEQPAAPKGEDGPSVVDFFVKFSQELIACLLKLFKDAVMHFGDVQHWD